MQPPENEPAKPPSAVTPISAPIGRDDEPVRPVIVTRATS
jgi:hypothetical protein